MSDPTAADRFHAHLDLCKRCRDRPFNLCPTGFALLQAGAMGTTVYTAPEQPPRDPRTYRDLAQEIAAGIEVRRPDDVTVILPDGKGGARAIVLPRMMFNQDVDSVTADIEANSMKRPLEDVPELAVLTKKDPPP